MKKQDAVEKLIQISDQCMTLHDNLKRRCNCRANVKRILRGLGVSKAKMTRKTFE